MVQVEIEFGVWKKLNNLLIDENDTLSSVIDRHICQERSQPKVWTYEGVEFPIGSEIKAKFKRDIHTGRVVDGGLLVKGEVFDSPSAAAKAVTGTQRNGWDFWSCRFPGSQTWIEIRQMRT